MYHPHFDEMMQMALGLNVMFIIRPRDPKLPRPDRDFPIMLSEWKIVSGTSRPDPNEMTDFNPLDQGSEYAIKVYGSLAEESALNTFIALSGYKASGHSWLGNSAAKLSSSRSLHTRPISLKLSVFSVYDVGTTLSPARVASDFIGANNIRNGVRMTQHNNGCTDRSELLHQMTSATQEVAQYIETTLAAENQHGLLIRHDVGL